MRGPVFIIANARSGSNFLDTEFSRPHIDFRPLKKWKKEMTEEQVENIIDIIGLKWSQ
jgi:hypothetical protein